MSASFARDGTWMDPSRWFALPILAVGLSACDVPNDSGGSDNPLLPEFFLVDVNGTYLEVVEPGSDPNPPTGIDLAKYGIVGGDVLDMGSRGHYSASSSEPEDNGQLFAIFVDDDGVSYPPWDEDDDEVWHIETDRTCPSYLDTDVPHDFIVPGHGVTVPEAATRLWFQPDDCFMGDNTDADRDYGVRIDEWNG